jgi:hypothetical protein
MAVDRRARWAGATLIVAVIALMVAQSGSDTPQPAARRRAAPAARPAAAAPTIEAPADVNLEALAAPREAPGDARRDPFQCGAKPAPPPAPPPKRIPGVADDQVGAPPVPVGPPPAPPPPPITLKFIGLVQKADGTKIAVLSDGKRPISGREGEEIEGRYKILKIGTESIEIAYIDGRGRQTIRLTGQ